VRAGEIGNEHGARIAAAIPAAFSALVGAARLSTRAFALAHDLDHPVCDCLYLALAELEDARLVTADGRLLARLRGSAWQELAQPLSPS
jgi:predicted nucleic acid-binding protein